MNDIARESHVFVCLACGKTARTRYGFNDDDGASNASPGWDASCMLNAKEFPASRLVFSPGGRVTEVLPAAPAQESP